MNYEPKRAGGGSSTDAMRAGASPPFYVKNSPTQESPSQEQCYNPYLIKENLLILARSLADLETPSLSAFIHAHLLS
jgi:hypothetical protein